MTRCSDITCNVTPGGDGDTGTIGVPATAVTCLAVNRRQCRETDPASSDSQATNELFGGREGVGSSVIDCWGLSLSPSLPLSLSPPPTPLSALKNQFSLSVCLSLSPLSVCVSLSALKKINSLSFSILPTELVRSDVSNDGMNSLD